MWWHGQGDSVSVKLLRQLIREVVRGWVDPEIASHLDWSENEKAWAQFGMGPEDFTMTATAAPELPVKVEPEDDHSNDCAYCSGSGMRDVGVRTMKCDICGGTGKVDTR